MKREERNTIEEERFEMASNILTNNGPIFLFVKLGELPMLRDMHARTIFHELERLSCINPDGFYMFYEPEFGKETYQKNSSWTELLPIENVNDFKVGFDRMGVRYASFEALFDAEDKFQRKYYCSYYDDERKQAFFIRNNPLVEADLKTIVGNESLGACLNQYQRDLTAEYESVLDKDEEEIRAGEFGLEKILDIKFGVADLNENGLNLRGKGTIEERK